MIDNKDELDIINKAKAGDEKSIKHLIDAHSGVCVNMYKKYLNPSFTSQYVQDDIINSKDYIIYNSINSYDPSYGSKFSTWLANQVRFYCLNCINKNKKNQAVEVEDIENISEDQQPKSDFLENLKKSEFIKDLKHVVENYHEPKIKKMIQLKYFSEDSKPKSFTEVARLMSVTVQTTINWHNKFIKEAKKKLEI